MKTLCLIIFFTPYYLLGQEVFYSPFTQTFPTIFTTKIEDINRKIYFEPNTISIVTDTKEGKNIEVLVIQETNIVNGNFVYLCQNKSKQKITISIPKEQQQVEVIDYYYRSSKTNEEIQLRFHVGQQQ